VVPGIDGRLNDVTDSAAITASGRHRAGIWVGERDLSSGTMPLELKHLLFARATKLADAGVPCCGSNFRTDRAREGDLVRAA
jgi:hypothetical protein